MPIEAARVTLLQAPSRLASSEITAPMDRFAEHRGVRASWYGSMQSVLVELHADGVSGVAVTQGGRAVAALLADHLLPLIMRAPLAVLDDIELLWERCRIATLPYGAGGLAAMARSAIDLAAWDLLGRMTSTPVVRLLGGELRALEVYATGNDIEHHMRLGMRTSKIGLQAGPWHDHGLRNARAQLEDARERAGSDHALMVDGWMGLDAVFVAALAPTLSACHFTWLEEPLPPDEVTSLDAVADALGDVLLATGEHCASVQSLLRLARHGVRVVQPDLAWFGGLTALRHAEARLPAGIEIAPHLSGTPWGVHAAAAMPAVRRVEWYVEAGPDESEHDVERVLRDVPLPVDGTIAPTEKAGFGVEVDEEFVARWGSEPRLIDA